ncbi:hypothetical protein GLOIN_2v1776798 [Rhizophagus irregularis DAOM 181602=DAOM 197198]|nr:hypothetical protein GLOIN_2v1776798 [Rhizophagus irregularis DAOM 181602=DAOM 197198]
MRSGYKELMLSIITEELKKYRENDDDDNIGHHSKKKLKLVEGIYDDDDIGYYSRKKLKSVESITVFVYLHLLSTIYHLPFTIHYPLSTIINHHPHPSSTTRHPPSIIHHRLLSSKLSTTYSI